MPSWIVASALSGCGWGLIAFLLMEARIHPAMIGALSAAPLIGIGMGVLSKGFARRRVITRSWLSLASLYLAAALFGTAGGLANAYLRGFGAAREPLESIIVIVLGLTCSGDVLFLAPLAYANHVLIDAVRAD